MLPARRRSVRTAEQNDRSDLRGHAQQGIGVLQSVQLGQPRRASPVLRLLNRYSRCKALWLCQRRKYTRAFWPTLISEFLPRASPVSSKAAAMPAALFLKE